MAKRGQRSASEAHAGTLPARLRARWTAVLLAALLAFSWQSFVTQTHVHFDPGYPAMAAKSGGAQQLSAKRSPADLPANCPLCREIAHAGAYLMPAPVALHVPAPAPVWLAVTRSTWLALNQRSHAWQSRAPPNQLQA